MKKRQKKETNIYISAHPVSGILHRLSHFLFIAALRGTPCFPIVLMRKPRSERECDFPQITQPRARVQTQVSLMSQLCLFHCVPVSPTQELTVGEKEDRWNSGESFLGKQKLKRANSVCRQPFHWDWPLPGPCGHTPSQPSQGASSSLFALRLSAQSYLVYDPMQIPCSLSCLVGRPVANNLHTKFPRAGPENWVCGMAPSPACRPVHQLVLIKQGPPC